MKLRQLAAINAGHPFRGKISEAAGSKVVAVQMKDVSPQRGIHWAGCTRTTLTGKRDPGWLQPGDILVAARGSHNYAVQIDASLPKSSLLAVAAPHFFVVRIPSPPAPGHTEVLPEYLAWLLNQRPCQRYFEQNAEGTLTKSIRRNVLEDTPVVVPPLAEQRAVVELAESIKRERQVMEQLLRNGEQLMSTIAYQLLNNKEVNHE